jgi:hypothetical protein
MPIRKSDIAIIHVGCASAAGYQLTRQLRSADARMGILLLAATHESATVRITGLERGAAAKCCRTGSNCSTPTSMPCCGGSCRRRATARTHAARGMCGGHQFA